MEGERAPTRVPGERIMQLVPVDMLPALMPVLLKNLDMLKKIRKEPDDADRVLMVPAQ